MIHLYGLIKCKIRCKYILGDDSLYMDLLNVESDVNIS